MKIKANNANSPIWKDVYSHSMLPEQLQPCLLYTSLGTSSTTGPSFQPAKRRSALLIAFFILYFLFAQLSDFSCYCVDFRLQIRP